MLYVFYGQDGYSITQAVDEVKAGLGDSETVATNTSVLEGRSLTLRELRTTFNALPFLGAHRLVIVNGLLGRFETVRGPRRSGKAAGKSLAGLGEWEDLDPYIPQMPDTTVLLLLDGDLKAQNPMLKRLSPLADVRSFPTLRGNDLKAWIHQRVVEEGGTIAPRAVSLLAEFIGGDLWAMTGEIQKLLLYCRERPIGEEDVRRLTSHLQEASIFALVDAVAEGRTESAQRTLHRLYRDGVAPVHILVMITRQFRLIAQAVDLKRGLSRTEIQNRLGLKATYALDRTLAQARAYDLDRVKQVYDKILDTDLAIKTGRYSDRLALELLVIELACTPATRVGSPAPAR